MLDREHLKKNNVSYWSHLFFALKVSFRLLASAVLLGLHSVIPALVVPKSLNLESMTEFLSEQNKHRDGWSNKGELGEDWF